MSHKSGHIIIGSLRTMSGVNAEQNAKLDEIEARDQYNLQDRLYLAMLVFQLTA